MLKAYDFSALGQSLLDIAIKVGSVAVVAFLDAVMAAVTKGTIQLPYAVATVPLLGLVISQLDSYFVHYQDPATK